MIALEAGYKISESINLTSLLACQCTNSDLRDRDLSLFYALIFGTCIRASWLATAKIWRLRSWL